MSWALLRGDSQSELTASSSQPMGEPGLETSPGETAGVGAIQRREKKSPCGDQGRPPKRGICPKPRGGGFGPEEGECHLGGGNWVNKGGRLNTNFQSAARSQGRGHRAESEVKGLEQAGVSSKAC